jgi:hypothetical protein
MEELLLGIIAGLKVAIFFVVLIYIYLARISLKKSGIYWLSLVALAFFVLSIREFLYVMGISSEEGIPAWIVSHDNLDLFFGITFLVVALGFFFFFNHINKNIKEYR